MVILIILSIVFFIAFVFLLKAWHFCKNKGYRALSRLLGMGAGIICLAFLISSFFAVKDFLKKADKRDLSQSDIVATGSEDSSLNASTLISEEVVESTDLASEDASDDIVETVIEGPKTYVFPVMSGYSYTSATLGITYNITADWKFADEAGLAKHDEITTTDFYEKLYTDVMAGNRRAEMFAESNDGYRTVGVSCEYVGELSSEDGSALLDEMISSAGFDDETKVANMYGAKSVAIEVSTTQFCGKEARRVRLVAEYDDDMTLYTDIFIFVNGDFVGTATANSVNSDNADLVEAFASA